MNVHPLSAPSLVDRSPRNCNGTQIIFISLPKSGTVFMRKTFSLTLGVVPFRFCILTDCGQIIDAVRFDEFLRQNAAIGGEHLSARGWTLDLLHFAGIDRIVLQIRDPRDAIVSMFHHLDRPDIREAWWVNAFSTATGRMPEYYFSLSPERRMDVMIDNYFLWFQQWIIDWMGVVRSDNRFKFHVTVYENFAASPSSAASAALRFLDYNVEPIFPGDGIERGNAISMNTHFRRGVHGSHRDEMTATQIERVNAMRDLDLFHQFGWT